MSTTDHSGPLAGVKVLDLSMVVSGPFCTMMLGDQGADVIKVESPGLGDPLRVFGALRNGFSSGFIATNRSKRSIVLDLQSNGGQQVLRDLIQWADVLVENFRPGVMERFGFDYESCRALNPDLIYVSINGFGDEGPHVERRVYDYVIQGISGMAAAQADPETGEPQLVRTLIFDKVTAITACQAITAALFARERGRGGQHVRVPMLNAALAFLWPDGMIGQTFLGGGEMSPPPLGKVYTLYKTSDGHITFGALQETEWQGICRATELVETLLADPRFSSTLGRMVYIDDIRSVLRGIIATKPTEYWCERFAECDVPHAPILHQSEVHEHPQVMANHILEETEHPTAGPFRQPKPPVRFSATPAEQQRHAPHPGEHTEEILRMLGHRERPR